MPSLQSTDVSVTRPDPGLQRPEPNWEKRRREGQAQNAEALAALKQMEAHLGGLLSAAYAIPANDVLTQRAGLIPSNGEYKLTLPQPYAALSLANLSTSQLSISKGPIVGSNPEVGGGVVRVAPGRYRTWPARDTEIRIYGQPGSPFDLSAFIRPQAPSSGACGITSGGVLIPARATTSQTIDNVGAGLDHIAVVLNTSAASGGNTVQLTINGVTPSGYVYPILVGIAVAAAAVTPYRVGPGFTPSLNAVSNDLVPPIIQVVTTVAGAVAYGVDLVAG
jgi:hypothetical protein